MTRDEVVERLCKLQAEAHAAIGYGSAADCFCGEGGFWGVDGYDGNEGYRNEGVVLEFMENAVRSALATRPSDPVPPEPRDPDEALRLGVRIRTQQLRELTTDQMRRIVAIMDGAPDNSGAAVPSDGAGAFRCVKCGYGSEEHGMSGHPAFQCVADMAWLPTPGVAVPSDGERLLRDALTIARAELVDLGRELHELDSGARRHVSTLPDPSTLEAIDAAMTATTEAHDVD